MNDPTKTVSSQTVTFACMKSWTVPSPYGVDSFPVNGPAITWRRSGSFQATFWFSPHWWTTSRTSVASTQPARSTERSATTWASVPRTGPVVITGEQMRTRRRERRIIFAIRAERSSP